jgi:hypothetical protein
LVNILASVPIRSKPTAKWKRRTFLNTIDWVSKIILSHFEVELLCESVSFSCDLFRFFLDELTSYCPRVAKTEANLNLANVLRGSSASAVLKKVSAASVFLLQWRVIPRMVVVVWKRKRFNE